MTKKQEKDLNEQLGIFVGEFIVTNFLPTLSCDAIKTNNVIQVTIGESDKYKKLGETWGKSYETYKNKNSKEWIELREYGKSLEIKYLPHTLKCNFNKITPTDIESFKEGVRLSLWDSDVCHYHIDSASMLFTSRKYISQIILTLDTEPLVWN